MVLQDMDVCAICGALLPRRMIAAQIDGTFTDYVDREVSTTTLALCDECRTSILEIGRGGLSAALRRASELKTENPVWGEEDEEP